MFLYVFSALCLLLSTVLFRVVQKQIAARKRLEQFIKNSGLCMECLGPADWTGPTTYMCECGDLRGDTSVDHSVPIILDRQRHLQSKIFSLRTDLKKLEVFRRGPIVPILIEAERITDARQKEIHDVVNPLNQVDFLLAAMSLLHYRVFGPFKTPIFWPWSHIPFPGDEGAVRKAAALILVHLENKLS